MKLFSQEKKEAITVT